MADDSDMVMVPRELVLFLLGEGLWHGVGFGERPASKPNFWWRSDLRAALSPSTTSTADQVERLCPCGKPSLPTAGVCSGCADACAADGGEGEAPVARRILWGPGEDWDFSNEADDPLTDADVERLRAQGYVVDRLYTRPTPATPEGLREKVEGAVQAWRETCASDGVARRFLAADMAHLIDAILAALQPQAQGGE